MPLNSSTARDFGVVATPRLTIGPFDKLASTIGSFFNGIGCCGMLGVATLVGSALELPNPAKISSHSSLLT